MTTDKAFDLLLLAYKANVAYRYCKFSDSDDIQLQIRHMAQWLTSDNPKFGAILCGECGNGKSTLLLAFQSMLNYLTLPNQYGNDRCGICIVGAKYIAHLCKENYSEFLNLAQYEMLGIDDLGTEPKEVADYGNILTPMVDLLSIRYEKRLFTIVTTNLSPKQIRECYGPRIADRLNEMMEKIIFRNGSYRKVEQ